ncbi:MAG: hypothetical protein K0U37_01900, partial [Gammaproteobacteria bacterium]|nr:hypothetical protein [Gammaproteobacteria bacterium]
QFFSVFTAEGEGVFSGLKAFSNSQLHWQWVYIFNKIIIYEAFTTKDKVTRLLHPAALRLQFLQRQVQRLSKKFVGICQLAKAA